MSLLLPTAFIRLLRAVGLLLGLLAALPAWAQGRCDEPRLKIHFNAAGVQGVFAANGRQILPYRYNLVYPLGAGLLAVSDDGPYFSFNFSIERWGVVDTTGRTVLPPTYGHIQLLACRYLAAQQGPVNLLFDLQGRELRRFAARTTFRVAARTHRLLVERQWPGPYRLSGELLDLDDPNRVYLRNPGGSVNVLTYHDGEKHQELPFFQAVNQSPSESAGRSRIVDAAGQVRLDSAWYTSSTAGLLFFQSHRGSIVTDTLLRALEPLSHRYFTAFATGPADRWVGVMDTKEGCTGVLDRAGREVLPIHYDGLGYTGRGTFTLMEARTYARSFLAANHQLVDLRDYYFDTPEDTLLGHGPIVLRHRVSGRNALLDPLNGHFLLPPRYETLVRFTHDVVFFQGDSAGYLDFQGRLLRLETTFRYFSGYHEGRAVVARNVKVPRRSLLPSEPGESNLTAPEPTPAPGPRPDSVQVFRYAYVDARGRVVSPFFDWAGPFQDGYACVRRGGEQYMVDGLFQPAVFGTARLVTYFLRGVAVVRDGTQYGLVDTQGRLVLPVQYQAIDMTEEYRMANGVVGPPGDNNATRWPMPLPRIQQGHIHVTRAEGESALLPLPGPGSSQPAR
jgi:hypothetical protein